MRLNNRVALVTGGGGGIGKEICLKLAAEGARVMIADITQVPREGGTSTLACLQDAGADAAFESVDVRQWADLDRAVSAAVARWGRLDIMVNNAATRAGGALLETSEEDWDQVMAVNAKGVFLGCKRAVQQMLQQQPLADGDPEVRGRIVNISSQHGMIRSPHDIAYGVGKATVVYMTRQIAGDYAAFGIVCNAVAPGKIPTGKPAPANEAELLAYSHARTPWPRLGRPRDVANAVCFLASDEASYISGENLMVDGGWMAN
jgi:NAD(P)-dependent dehydrogenase (short-subunit alcohol dehydrogenase family)